MNSITPSFKPGASYHSSLSFFLSLWILFLSLPSSLGLSRDLSLPLSLSQFLCVFFFFPLLESVKGSQVPNHRSGGTRPGGPLGLEIYGFSWFHGHISRLRGGFGEDLEDSSGPVPEIPGRHFAGSKKERRDSRDQSQLSLNSASTELSLNSVSTQRSLSSAATQPQLNSASTQPELNEASSPLTVKSASTQLSVNSTQLQRNLNPT